MSEKTHTTIKSSGISFSGLLAIVFITLKLCKVIDWSWLWVLAPIWIPVAIGLSILVAVGIFMLIAMVIATRK